MIMKVAVIMTHMAVLAFGKLKDTRSCIFLLQINEQRNTTGLNVFLCTSLLINSL